MGNKNCAMLLLGCMVLCHHHPVKSLKINMYGGLEDVVISVGNDVPPIICQQLLQNIHQLFSSASDYLYAATDGFVYFERITVVLPSSWGNTRAACGQLVTNYTSLGAIDQAQFRLGSEHPIFGHSPYTQQSQGCGRPGDYIALGYKYLFPNYDNMSDSSNPFPERTIIHEWTKYRYGVFEEIGFENDPIYPLTYKISNNNDELRPNYCTNVELHGNWSSSSSSCNVLTGENCAFNPLLNNYENVTSSIMSVPNLPNVRNYCDASSHNYLAPTKHNFQCMGKSIQDVMNDHPDFMNVQRSSARQQRRKITPMITVKQITPPRYVLLIEETVSMNLREVWKFLKLAVRKFIKYDLQAGTQVGILTINTDIEILANMTTLANGKITDSIADKLPHYPLKDTGNLSLRKGISQAINMLKWNGATVAGSVIILISQATISPVDIDASLHLLKQEQVACATIEYPARSGGDGPRVAVLSQGTNSPFFSVRETGVGHVSHLSTYIQLVNAMTNIQRFFTLNLGGDGAASTRFSTLIHQQEFRGDEPQSFVQSSFNFDVSQPPAQFHIFVANPNDPRINKVELISPDGRKYTDMVSVLQDINVIKIDANIDQPGLWHYHIERIERFGDTYQSHFVQVVTTGSWSQQQDQLTVRIYSNVHETRAVNFDQYPLILYADVKKGASPVLSADVEAFISTTDAKWSTKLFDNGNGDPDITGQDGVYSRYILPPTTIRAGVLDITVKVITSPKNSKFITSEVDPPLSRSNMNNYDNNKKQPSPCCGSVLVSKQSNSLKTMPYNERMSSLYSVKVTDILASHNYPPSRIGDLKVLGSVDKNVTFQFTAPGDDFDHGIVQNYSIYFSDSRELLSVLKIENLIRVTSPGDLVNFTTTFETYNIYYVWVQAIDPYQRSGPQSNIVQVIVSSPSVYAPDGAGNSDLLAEGGSAEGSQPGGNKKFGATEIVLTVVGVVGLCVVVVGISWSCICCRRKASKKETNSTETKVFTISEVKQPIHWSASELLNEHEKRQSIYAQSHPKSSDNPSHRHDQGRHLQLSQRQSQLSSTRYHNASPESSLRSFRSFTEGQWRASLDAGSSRRPTLTDYESCSSDPIIRGGPTDYDTAVDSETDQENLHYRTIDSYVGRGHSAHPVGANHNLAMIANEGSVDEQPSYSGQQQTLQVQYNYNANNYQGSLTSVNSKRRNITMV